MGGYQSHLELIPFVLPDMLSGMIIIWSGAEIAIPSGFVLCDGNNGTPNLKDQFVVGAGATYAVGASAGNATHGHSASQSSHYHSLDSGDMVAEGGDMGDSTDSKAPTVTIVGASNLPPYYALCYIMKT